MDTKTNLKALIDQLREILRNEEGITGMDAMRDICRFIMLKYIDHLIVEDPEPGKIDLLNPEYYEEEAVDYLQFCRFQDFSKLSGSELDTAIKNVVHFIYKVHPTTKSIFDDKRLTITKERTLETLIAEINKYNLDTVGTDTLGDVYEYFLSQLTTGKELGQFFTNRKIINFALNQLFADIPPDMTDISIYDPCAGTCGFLTQGYKKLKSEFNTVTVTGNDIQTDTVILGNVNMLMNTGMLHNIQKRDSLRTQDLNEYDYIITNPPFGLKPKWAELEKQYAKDRTTFEKLFPVKSTSSVELFLESLLPKMKHGMCMVVPYGSEMNGKRATQIAFRKLMLESYHLYKMIIMPPGIFEYTNIQTAIMFWKPKSSDHNMHLDFMEIDPGFKLNKKTMSKLKNLEDYLKPIISVSKIELEKNQYSLYPKAYLRNETTYTAETVKKKMSELFDVKKGTFNTKDMDDTGDVPFYNCSYNNPIGKHSSSTYESETPYLLLLTGGGSRGNDNTEKVGLGKVFLCSGKTAFVNDVLALIPKYDVDIKYLYWYFTINKNKLLEIAKFSTGLGHINMTDLKTSKSQFR